MVKKICLLAAIFCCTVALKAQQLSATDMVAITPMVSTALKLPEDAIKSLGVKLGQMVTQNGFGSNSSQFVLTANLVVLDKQATATTPVQFMVDLEVSVYLLDVEEGVAIDEMSFNVKGVDRLENKAMIQAINTIKPKSTKTAQFMANCRQKIIDYYNARIPVILTKSKSLADRDEYEEAIYLLSGVPECIDQYPQVADMMTQVYVKMLDRDALAAIKTAKGQIAIKNYEEAFDALEAVHPSSTHYKEAVGMINQVKQQILAKENAAYAERIRRYDQAREDAMRIHDDKVMLTKMNIEAAKAVGTAVAKNSKTTVSVSVNKWLMGKFK